MAEHSLMASGFHTSVYFPGRFCKDYRLSLSNFNFNRNIQKLSFHQQMHRVEEPFKSIMEFSSKRPLFVWNLGHSYRSHLPVGHQLVTSSCTEMKYLPGTLSEFYTPNNAIYWKKQPMQIQYFNRRISKAAKTNCLGSSSDFENMKSSPRLKNSAWPGKKNSIDSFLCAFRNILTILFMREYKRNGINYYMQQSPEMIDILAVSWMIIAYCGIDVILSVVWKNKVSFFGSKFLTVFLGTTLILLSHSVKKLEDIFTSIKEDSEKQGEGDGETMRCGDDKISEFGKNIVEIHGLFIVAMVIDLARDYFGVK